MVDSMMFKWPFGLFRRENRPPEMVSGDEWRKRNAWADGSPDPVGDNEISELSPPKPSPVSKGSTEPVPPGVVPAPPAVSAPGPASGLMYEAFYGLNERPFTTLPDPQFLYWSEAHQLAYAILHYGIMTRAPITVITGEIGAGKTTLLRRLLGEIPEDLTVGLVSNMKEGRGELLHWVMMALGQEFDASEPYVVLFKRFQEFLVRAYAEGRRVVVVVDEAQNLGAAALEELRMYTNINADKDELLQLVLVGQPQLRELLSHPDLVQFTQRISADFHLEPLSETETANYIQRRLEIAGATRQIFTDEACARICQVTGGVPRLVNILCDICLVYGFAEDRQEIDVDVLDEILSSAERRGIFGQFDGKDMAQPERVAPSG